jgi:hypothetical protein
MVLRRPLFVSVRVYKDWATVFLPAAPIGIGLRRGTLRSGCSGRRRCGRLWGRRHRADNIWSLTVTGRLFDRPRRCRAPGRNRSGG